MKIKSKIVMQMRLVMLKIINPVIKKCDTPNFCRIKIETARIRWISNDNWDVKYYCNDSEFFVYFLVCHKVCFFYFCDPLCFNCVMICSKSLWSFLYLCCLYCMFQQLLQCLVDWKETSDVLCWWFLTGSRAQ